MVQLGDEYGQARMLTQVYIDGEELERCSWGIGGYSSGAELEGFTIGAYIGYQPIGGPLEDRGLWGASTYVEIHRIENARQASAIARVMARVEKSLDKQSQESGYLTDADYAGYVLRVAKALGIKTIYVRNSFEAERNSGVRFRKVDGAALQYYVSAVVADVRTGHKADYIKLR
jgi:hypothetical protein